MFHRRLIVLILLLVLVMSVLVSRLAWLQIMQGQKYLDTTLDSFKLPAQWIDTVRGSILDCNNRGLAVMEASFDLCLHYELTRLYDERFWEYQHECLRRLKKHEGKTEDQLKEILEEKYGESRREADKILADLTDLCNVDLKSFHQSIHQLNNKINDLKMVRARRVYCNKNDMKYISMPGIESIRQDFKRLVPDDIERAYLIGKEKIMEMNQEHTVLNSVSKDVALRVEEVYSLSKVGSIQPVSIQPVKKRVYPYGDVACHLLGQVGPSSVSELSGSHPPAEKDFQAYHLSDRKGDWGIEKMFEPMLRGRRGWEYKDIQGNHIIEPVARELGKDVILTIDIELQKAIQELFEAENYIGAAVVIDVPTGYVRSMVSVPTYDLNTYYAHKNYKAINDPKDPGKRIMNRAISKNYQPGSTVKPMILLGALSMGVAHSGESIECHARLKDWRGYPKEIKNHGLLDEVAALRESCNFYFIKLSQRMGPKRLSAWLDNIGRGRKILAWPMLFKDESYGFQETRGNLKPVRSQVMSVPESRFSSIGRGALDGSILHVANDAATIARNGVFMSPTIVKYPDPQQKTVRVASVRQARTVVKGMYEVVNHVRGTAHKAFYPDVLWEPEEAVIYGKTGSTDYALFSCFVKAADGKCIALGLLVEQKDAGGGEVAAPMARKILALCGDLGYLPEPNVYITEFNFN